MEPKLVYLTRQLRSLANASSAASSSTTSNNNKSSSSSSATLTALELSLPPITTSMIGNEIFASDYLKNVAILTDLARYNIM